MELGAGIEAGGIFSSASSVQGGVHQLVMEFQLNGGNAWAQCRCHGLMRSCEGGVENYVEVVSLSVSNMDAALNGGWIDISVPREKKGENEDNAGYELPYIE